MIDRTGYWGANWAPAHHAHSQNLSDWLINFLQNNKNDKIYDFGCGMGTYLKDLYDNGFNNLKGFEMEPPKLYEEFDIQSQNLAVPFILDEKGIIISLEVGEHIPKEYQDIFLDNLANNVSKYLIISWALRGQGGYGHFNELNNDEIRPEIEKRGFKYLSYISESARKVPEDVYWYFRNTIMIFEKI